MDQRVGLPIMLKRGRISQAELGIAAVPVAIDVRAERVPPPAHFTEQERQLWNQLTAVRRPGWYGGALELLESYCTLSVRCRQLEAALRRLDAAAPQADRLARQHRQALALAASLAGRLRLTPNSRLDRRLRQEGDDSMTEQSRDQPGPRLLASNDDGDATNGERSFERLRQRMYGAYGKGAVSASFSSPEPEPCWQPTRPEPPPSETKIDIAFAAMEDADVAAYVGAIATRATLMATEAADGVMVIEKRCPSGNE
jgi:hypothetical protein